MQAVILAAGKGTRLRPLTDRIPKALVDIKGVPLIGRILAALPRDITEIVIVVGHLAEQIRAHIGPRWNGIPVRYVVQDPLDGTGTAIHLAKGLLRGSFLVVNGDDLYDQADLARLCGHPLAILLHQTNGPISPSALVDAQGHFIGLETKPPQGEHHRRVCGAYVLDERFFRYPLAEIPVRDHVEFSLPHTLVNLAKDLSVRAEIARFWQPVGTPEEWQEANRMT